MNWWRSLIFVALLMIVAAACMMVWRSHSAGTTPAANAAQTKASSVPNLYPGGSPPANEASDEDKLHEEYSGNDVSEGKRLYKWFNCNTCHVNGGGAIGPALMDDKWI